MKHTVTLAVATLLTGLATNYPLAEQLPTPPQNPDSSDNRFRNDAGARSRKDADTAAGSKRDYLKTPKDGVANIDQNDSEKKMWESLGTTQKASDIIGSKVRTRDFDQKSDSHGKVEDLAIDFESGRVLEVIVATGSWFSGGTHHISVPPSALIRSADAKGYDLNYDTEKVKGAPAFDVDKWDQSVSEESVTENYKYYGSTPYWTANSERSHRLDNAARNDADRNIANEVPNGAAKGSTIQSKKMGRLDRASRVVGMAVLNNQDEKLGKVDNMLVDLHSGRIVHVVLSTGGFLGIADELSLVPPSAFKFSADRDSLRLDTTKGQLSSSPHFNGQTWPDVNDPAYVSGVYNAYKVQPYFNTNTLPNNTARNIRERDSKSLTPLDQGNSRADIEVSRRIRKEIMAKENLSVDARNVKIITTNGRVTLKGPVANEAEMKVITEIASNAVQNGNVNNQLEIENRQ